MIRKQVDNNDIRMLNMTLECCYLNQSTQGQIYNRINRNDRNNMLYMRTIWIFCTQREMYNIATTTAIRARTTATTTTPN